MKLKTYHFEGTPEAIGLAHGETLRDMIGDFCDGRYAAARQYFNENGAADKSLDGLLGIAAECLEALKSWDHEGYLEHMAIAKGANIDPLKLLVATGYTDIRDAYILAGDKPDSEGCTAFLLPSSHTRSGHLMGGQSWDLTPNDLDYVVAIHTKPEGQPEKWSIATAGCLSLMGMNEHGIAVGTTNIKTYGSRPGVSYINILHKALRMKDKSEIQSMIEQSPRSGAHTYWVLDSKGGFEVETTPQVFETRFLEEKPLVWTNHCLVDSHIACEYQPPGTSSLARIKRMEKLVNSTRDIDHQFLVDAFANREDGVDSINRYPEDEQGTATNACMIVTPQERSLYACRGPADRGEWITLGF